MLTMRPVSPRRRADRSARQRNAGICSDVGDVGGRRRLRRLVDVGEDRHAVSRLDARRAPAALRRGPGRETIVPDVRFALSNDALKMNGTPTRRAMSTSRPARSRRVCFALDDARTGDERERAAAADRDVAQLQRGHGRIIRGRDGRTGGGRMAAGEGSAAFLPGLRRRAQAAACSARPSALRRAARARRLVLVRRRDECGEQRMRPRRLRLELRVELDRDDTTDDRAARRSRRTCRRASGRRSAARAR